MPSLPGPAADVVLRELARSGRRSRRKRARRAAIVAALAAGVVGGSLVGELVRRGGDADTAVVPAPAQARATLLRLETIDALLAAAATPARAQAALGVPAGRERTGEACRIEWPSYGVSIAYTAPKGRNPCTVGAAAGALVDEPGLATADGLEVGDPLRGLRGAYPAAERRPDGWWALAGGDGPPALMAHVHAGRVDAVYAATSTDGEAVRATAASARARDGK